MSPSFTNAETNLALGRLEGGVEAMKESIESLTLAIDRDRADAFARSDLQAKRLSNLEAVVSSIRHDMDIVKPLAEKWRRWQYVGLGVLMTVFGIGSAIGAAMQFFHDQVIAIIGIAGGQ